MMPACKRLLAGFAVATLLLLPATARAADEPPDPFAEYPVVQHGNMHVHTAISSSSDDHRLAQKLWETLNEADDIGLDFVGLADHAEAMADEHFLVTRGTVAVHPEATGRDVVGLPGFELTQGQEGSSPFKFPALHVNVFGSDHYAQVAHQKVKWPVFKIGDFFPTRHEAAWGYKTRELTHLEPLGLLVTRSDIHLFLANYALKLWDSSDAAALNEVRESDQFDERGMDSVWGHRFQVPSSASNLAGALQEHGLQRTLLVQDWLRDRLEGLSGRFHVTARFEEARKKLIRDLASSPSSGFEDLAVPPGVPLDNPQKDKFSLVAANRRMAQLYAEYYTLLWRGLHLWDGVAVPSSATALKTDLESDRHAWWSEKNDLILRAEPGSSLVFQWLNETNSQGPMAAQINHPWAGGEVNLDLLSAQEYLGISSGSTRPTKNEVAWKRVCLQEVTTDITLATGVLPLGGGVAQHLPYYNLALANHWRVAPSAGIDNAGWLKDHADGLEAPRARQNHVGLWLTAPPSGSSADKMRAVMEAFRQRRTYASENPHLQVRLSAVVLDDQGRPTGTGAVMGQDLVARSGRRSGSAQFLLELRAEGDGQFKVRNRDIKLVSVRDASGWNPANAEEKGRDQINDRTRVEAVFADLPSSPSFRKASIPSVTEWATADSPLEFFPDHFGARDRQGSPLPLGIRCFWPGKPLKLWAAHHFKQFDPAGGNDVLCYYALVRFLENGQEWYAVSAPLWLANDSSYAE